MIVSRTLGGLVLLLSVYYVRFYVLRQEPVTAAQIAALWCAAALLLLQRRPETPHAVWFRGWWPSAWQGWVAAAAAVVAVVAVFRIMDAGAHSASDTLNRVAPTYSLMA